MRGELERIKDMAETGKIDRKRLREMLDGFEHYRIVANSDIVTDALAECTSCSKRDWEEILDPLYGRYPSITPDLMKDWASKQITIVDLIREEADNCWSRVR